jgi:hypothetical protein
MHILSTSRRAASVALTPHEQRCFINALGEIRDTYQFPALDFPARIGIAREAAGRLLQAIHAACPRDRMLQMTLTWQELGALRGAMQVVSDEIEDWEFGTRLGVARDEWSEVMRSLDEVRSHAADP